MKRLLIVDDEPLIADGLYEYFVKAELGELEILKVYSAHQALEWLDTVKVDIIISDICMPGMDGMEFIQEIEERWARCKVILLTGHNEFDYVHQAIRNPCVVDYLLKTEGMEKIRHTVESTLKQITEENVKRYQLEWYRDKLPKALPQLQKQLLIDLLRRKEPGPALQEELDAVQLPFRGDQVVLPLLVKIEEWTDYDSEFDQGLLCYAAANITEELMAEQTIAKAVGMGQQSIICFVQPQPSQMARLGECKAWERAIRYVMGMMESVQQACSDYLKLSVSVISGNQAVPWTGLQQALNRLELAVLESPGYRMEKLLRVDVEGAPAEHKQPLYRFTASKLIVEQMVSRVLEGQEDWAASFRQWTELTGEEGPSDPFIRLRQLQGIGEGFFYCLQEIGLSPWEQTEYDLTPMLGLDIHSRWAEVVTFYRQAFQWILSKRMSNFQHDESHILMNIHYYIKQQLSGDLSLTRIAQEVSLNPSYLSRWYKKLTGKGLSDYITERKIERSKELLASTSLRMQDISKELGFTDQHYFFRFFKKAVGCTPQEYRDQR